MSYFPYTFKQVFDAMKSKGYVVFEREYDLNIVGIRTNDMNSNFFNDWICIFHKRNNGTWAFYAFQCTTDPGLFWRLNPERVDGVAILVPNQYRSMWTIGKHQGRYKAFVQQKEVTVYRDSDKNSSLDIDPKKVTTGLFGINGHRAKEGGTSSQVDKWSAGCQVWASDTDFQFALTLADKQVESGHGNKFTYTLLVENDLKRS